MSWGVRRIEDESTDPVDGGGRPSAMTVGEWLDQVSSARGRFSGPAPVSRPEPRPDGSLETLDRKIEELNKRLKRLSETPKPSSRFKRPDRDGSGISRRPARGRTSEVFAESSDPVTQRLDQIDRRLAEMARSTPDHQPVVRGSVAVSGVSDAERVRQGLREIERLQATLIDGLNERGDAGGSAITRHLKDSQSRETSPVSPVAETIARLENEVRGLRQTVESRHATAAPTIGDADLQAMRHALVRLAELDSERQGPGQVDRLLEEMNRLRELVVEVGSKAAVVQPTHSPQESRLADMVERLASVATSAQEKTSEDIRLLDRKLSDVADRIADLETSGADAGDLKDLQHAIDAIAAKLDRSSATSKPMIPAGLLDLDVRIEKLSEKIDRIEPNPVSARQMAGLESEIAALRLDLAQSTGVRGSSRIEAELSGLSARIDRLAQAGAAIPQGLDRFEGRISDLVDMLGRMVGSEATLDKHLDALHGEVGHLRRELSGFGDIGNLETKLNRIESLLAARRDDTLDAASFAAREAVREFAALAPTTAHADVDVRALEQDLRKIHDVSRKNELRTGEALQSVHDALTTISSRLGAIERRPADRETEREPGALIDRGTATRGPSTPQAPNRAATPLGTSDLTPPLQPRSPHPDAREPASGSSVYARSPEPQAFATEDTRPLEPGSGKPRGLPTAAAGPGQKPSRPPVTQGQASTGPSPGGPIDSGSSGTKRNEFIAAARRAALAASQTGPGAPPPVIGERTKSSAHPDGDTNDQPTKTSLIGSLFKSKQKSLIVAGVGVAAAATAASFLTASAMRTASVDAMPTASIALQRPATLPSATAPSPGNAGPTAAGAASVALAPPSSVASTFTQTPVVDEPTRQAALADAIKQSAQAQAQAQAQGAATQQIASAQPVAPASLPVANTAASPVSDGLQTQSINKPQAPQPATASIPMPSEKIGSLALRTAATGGDPKAQFEVGMRYSEGRGMAPDLHEASVWFERSGSQGFAPAAYRLGSAYEKGLGVERNVAEAKRWYRSAAEAGNVRAMHNLGVLYANDRDMPSALPWFQKAADAGLKDSQFNLGIIYALGSGVKQDLAVSYKWFALGANQGDQEAVKKRDDIATHLDHTALAAAKMAVSTWRPMPVSRDANDETAVWAEPAATAAASSATAASPAPVPPAGWSKLMQAQAALQGKGLYTGKVDGDMTPETKAAIKAFQKKAGLKPTGEIDNAFMSALLAKQL